MHHTLKLFNNTLYCDVAVWGPHFNRSIRVIELTGLMLERYGALRSVEIKGPAPHDIWEGAFDVFMTGMVMMETIDYARLMTYAKFIAKCVKRYGENCRTLIYRIVVRMRARGERLAADTARAGGKSIQFVWSGAIDYDAYRPCHWTYHASMGAAIGGI